MNPNRLNRKLKELPGNVHSSKLPGGSLVSAALDRTLMAWSDKGGASRRFGEIWSEYAWNLLTENDRKIPSRFREVTAILRLDANPRIAIQAGRHKLPNPDFLLLKNKGQSAVELRAIDAKFAIDRLRRSQISPDSVRELVDLSGSLARHEIMSLAHVPENARLSYETGAFLAPNSLLNDHFYNQITSGQQAEIPVSEIILVEVLSETLFSDTEEYSLMTMLRELDGLAGLDADSDIVAGSYYFRLARAASWFEEQVNAPLLSIREFEPIPMETIEMSARERLSRSTNAYQLMYDWSNPAIKSAHLHTRVREAARAPFRMEEIRKMLARVGSGEDRKRQRVVRGALERKFLTLLIDEIGEIPARPVEGIQEIIDRIHRVRRTLRPELKKYAAGLIDETANESPVVTES